MNCEASRAEVPRRARVLQRLVLSSLVQVSGREGEDFAVVVLNSKSGHNGPMSVTDSYQIARFERFRQLHAHPGIFVIPNPWDAGSARILTALQFQALATTSAGFAFSIGKKDMGGGVTREE